MPYVRTLLVTFFVFLTIFSDHLQASERFFGYWANNQLHHENSDHTNLNQIVVGGWPDMQAARQMAVNEALLASSNGVSIMLNVDTFLFEWDQPPSGATGLGHCPFSFEQNAADNWDALVQDLIQNGILVHGDPAASTVSAFVIVDEPERCGLNDIGPSPHPTLQHAVDVVRGHPATSNFPVVITASKDYATAINGIRLADWAGMFDYHASTAGYLSNLANFQSQLLNSQRSIIIQQASQGGFMSGYGPYHDPDSIFEFFTNNPKAIGILTFLWANPGTTGTRDIGLLRQAYENIGGQIATNNVIDLSLICFAQTGGSFQCSATATGGDPAYDYQWSDACLGSGHLAQCYVDCSSVGSSNEIAAVTVTDQNGFYRIASQQLTCFDPY